MQFNIFSKFFKNLFVFDFSNEFVDEHVGKVLTYMAIGFLLINIIVITMFVKDVNQYLDDDQDFIHVEEGVGINYTLIDSMEFEKLTHDSTISVQLYIFLGFMIVLETIVVLMLILMASVLAYIIKTIMNKEVTVFECIKVGMYSITVPNILLAFQFLTRYEIPLFPLVYLIITFFYAYKYLSAYKPYINDNVDMMGILFNRVEDNESK